VFSGRTIFDSLSRYATSRMRIEFHFYITTDCDIFCHSLLLFSTLYLAVFVAVFDILPSLLLFTTLHLTINFCCLQCYVLTLIIVICDYILHHSSLFCYFILCHLSIWVPSDRRIYQISFDYRVRITQQYKYYIRYILLKNIAPNWYGRHQLALPAHKKKVCFLGRDLPLTNREYSIL
jgi:hypothetical protein